MEQRETGKWILTLTVMLGTMMNAIDSSIVNVAVPSMRGSLGASVEEISWVSTGYILSNVIITPLIAMVSTRFGRKRFYLACVILFTASSLLCGMATSLTMLVFARILQGIGGGALAPLSQAILRERFPPHEQGTAMGIFGLGVVIGPALGPTFGGWLTDNYSWPWIFYINIPLGIINVFMVMRHLHDPPYLVRDRGRMDLAGLFLLVLGLGSLQLMLEQGETNDWFDSGFIISLLFLAVSGLVLFVVRELTTERPVVDLTLLKNRNFVSGVVISSMLGMGLYASMFLLPIFLQQILKYPAMESGWILLPRSIAMGFTLPVVGRLYNRLGPKVLVIFGLLVSSTSFFLMSHLSLDAGYWNLFVIQALQGVGFGTTFVTVSTAALSTVERTRMMAASGLYNVFRQVFGSIGIALTATMFTRGQNIQRVTLVADITPYSRQATQWIEQVTTAMQAKCADPVMVKLRTLHLLDELVTRQAAMLSFNYIYSLLTLVFLATLPCVLLLKKTRMSDTAAEVMVD